jgi:hypothetical protein
MTTNAAIFNEIENIKTNAEFFIYNITAKHIDLNNNKIFGNEYIYSQILYSNRDAQKEATKIAQQNNVAVIDFDNECIDAIKSSNNIVKDILVLKTEENFMQSDFTIRTSIKVDYLNPGNFKRLNSDVCKNNKQTKIKLPLSLSDMDAKLYRKFQADGIDIFNPLEPAFRTRCFSYVDYDIDYDTTLNYRRKNYFQNRTDCQENGCVYESYSTDGYITCKCNTVNTDTVNNTFSEASGIMLCSGKIIGV